MAVSLEHQTSVSSSFGQVSVNNAFGSTVPSGDLLIIMIARDAFNPETSGYNFRMVSSGFTELLYNATNPPDTSLQILYKISEGTETSAYVQYDTDSQATDTVHFFARFSGINTSNPFNVVGTPESLSGSDELTVSAVTTTVDGCYGVCFFGFDGGDGNPFSASNSGWNSSPYYEESGDGGGDVGGGWTYNNTGFSAGSSGDVTISSNGTSDGMVGVQFAIAPFSTAPSFNLNISGVLAANISSVTGVSAANIESFSGS